MNLRTDRGATVVEYSMLLALIAAVLFATVSVLGSTASDTFDCPGYLFQGETCVQGSAAEPSPSPSPTSTPTDSPPQPDPSPTGSCKNPTGRGKVCTK